MADNDWREYLIDQSQLERLSPAALAVTSAAASAQWEHDPYGMSLGEVQEFAATILRALADHQSPAWDGTGPACHWSPDERTRRELRNIAAELEGGTSTSSTHSSSHALLH